MPNVPNNTVVTNIPQGVDRADGTPYSVLGQTIQMGTPTSANGLITNTPNGDSSVYIPVNEQPDSPTIERAEQCTCVHKVTCSWAAAQLYLGIYGRGKLLADSSGNWYRVLSSSIQHKKGDYAEMVITSESISFDSPPDEFQITPTKLNIDLLKHPRYFSNLVPKPGDNSDLYAEIGDQAVKVYISDIKQSLVRMIQTYRDSPFFPSEDNINGLIQNNILSTLKDGKLLITTPYTNFNGDLVEDPPEFWDGDIATEPTGNPRYVIVPVPVNLTNPADAIVVAIAATKEIIQKLWRMEDTPMINGWELTWSAYYFRPPNLNPGAYVEDPFGQQEPSTIGDYVDGIRVPPNAVPPVPEYFYSPSWPASTSTNVFDWISSINPQCYSKTGKFNGGVAISWLRDADTIEYNRTWFKVTRKWLGAPVGAWDADLYNQFDRPSLSTDYNTTSP